MSAEAAAAALSGPPTGSQQGEPTVAPEAQRGRLSDMQHATLKLPPLDRPTPSNEPAKPEVQARQAPTPEVAEGEPIPDPLEAQPEATPEEQPAGPTPEELAAEWQKHKDSPDLDLEAFGDKVIWTKDRDGNPVPMRVADVERHTMLYGDYQFKTRELAAERRAFQQQEAGMRLFQQDLLSGDPQLGMRALRHMGADKTLHSIVVAYVKRMARLEGMDPALRDEFLAGERAQDEAAILRRQVQAREAHERMLAEQQAQQQGINAPDIQHVMGHIEARLPQLYKQMGVIESDALQRELGDVLREATEGRRGPDGRWIEAPVIQRGRTPTDDVLRQLVGTANERVLRLVAKVPRQAPQLPPSPAAASVSGPAAKPGQRGNISQPERKRWSDMR